uniref:HD domain-containing phosphohydrolase n=1 Tax=Comamonas testosteroni TaxID=285 RepID=UPI00155DB7BF|nr:HD domain-containing phosphohydrolase [Comamonas testosteroni]
MGHSRQVASLALRAAQAVGLDEAERQRIYLAGLMHDIGLAAVPNGILDRSGPLNPIEMSQARAHSHHTNMVLSVAPALAAVLSIISSAHRFSHEDAAGDAGARIDDMAPAIVAAADRYHSLTRARPWRAAAGADAAAQSLGQAVAAGQLPANAVRAVLEAAGHAKRSARRVYPDGLSPREAGVLELLARGQSTKAIASTLAISPKTADHHVQAVYAKTGVRSRAAAALYALSHGIVERLGSFPISGSGRAT